MQLSTVVDTVIGVSFTFFLLSVVSSAVAEWIATIFKKRAKYLLRGLRQMLDGPRGLAPPVAAVAATWWGRLLDIFTDLPWARGLLLGSLQEDRLHRAARDARLSGRGAAATRGAVVAQALGPDAGPPGDHWGPAEVTLLLIGHPLVSSQRQESTFGIPKRIPSYLSASTASTALIDLIVPDGDGLTSVVALEAQIRAAHLPVHLEGALLALTRQADGDLQRFREGLEHWYDTQMEHISGAYKRWIKRWLLVIAAAFVLALHVDALAIGVTLWSDPTVRPAVASSASTSVCAQATPQNPTNDVQQQAYARCLRDEQTVLTSAGVPIGPPRGCSLSVPGVVRCVVSQRAGVDGRGKDPTVREAATTIAGLGLSVLAASFGAPFWFQVLTRAASLRNTGARPGTSASS